MGLRYSHKGSDCQSAFSSEGKADLPLSSEEADSGYYSSFSSLQLAKTISASDRPDTAARAIIIAFAADLQQPVVVDVEGVGVL